MNFCCTLSFSFRVFLAYVSICWDFSLTTCSLHLTVIQWGNLQHTPTSQTMHTRIIYVDQCVYCRSAIIWCFVVLYQGQKLTRRKSKLYMIICNSHLGSAQTQYPSNTCTHSHEYTDFLTVCLPFSENSQSFMAWSQSARVRTAIDDLLTLRWRTWLYITMCLRRKLSFFYCSPQCIHFLDKLNYISICVIIQSLTMVSFSQTNKTVFSSYNLFDQFQSVKCTWLAKYYLGKEKLTSSDKSCELTPTKKLESEFPLKR